VRCGSSLTDYLYNASMSRLTDRLVSSLLLILFLLSTVFAKAADRQRLAPDGTFIATTGRIMMIDLKNKTLRVRASDDQFTQRFLLAKQGDTSTVITFPRGATIRFPQRTGRHPSPAGSTTPNLNQYMVVITSKTVIQDGAEPMRLEDFTIGETISIHGWYAGNTLTASRIAKWS
jgi:hypothetical protein